MFIKEFSEAEILEYRFSMSDEEFQGWFRPHIFRTIVGYVSVGPRSWKKPYRDFIPYRGKHQMMLVVKNQNLFQVLDAEMVIISNLRETLLVELIKNNNYSLQVDGQILCRI